MHDTPGDAEEARTIKRILETTRNVAVVGLSANPERDSHRVARYLERRGYRVFGVNPRERVWLGQPCFATLDEIPEPVHLVDVFRRAEHVPELADAALRIGVPAFWMQLGIRHPAAAARLRAAGVDVVEDRCTAVEVARLSG